MTCRHGNESPCERCRVSAKVTAICAAVPHHPGPQTAPVRQQQPTRIVIAIIRPDRCEHIGKREEFKHGCNGFNCRWDCAKGLPAVPGKLCQTCTEYVPETGIGWL